MKILIIISVVAFIFLAEILCVAAAAKNATTTITTTATKPTRPTIYRSKNTVKGNTTEETSNPTGITLTTAKLAASKVKVVSTRAPFTTTLKPVLNQTSSVVPINSKFSSSAKKTDLSYPGCGIRKNENHPWIAVIEHTPPKYLDNSKLRVRKTLSKGVLIHPNYVLTTISSIHNSHPFWIVSAVRLGDKMTLDISDHNTTSLLNPVKVSIEEVFLHRHKDIAIIKLAHKINVTDYIRPICLPTDHGYNYRELFLHFCKYRSFRRNTRERRVTTEPVSPISPQDCRILFTRKQSEISVENEFCAWDEIGDTCAGDIGGPLFVEIDSKNTIIGLKSMATSENEDLQLDTTIPGIYTRVGAYITWIAAIINSNN